MTKDDSTYAAIYAEKLRVWKALATVAETVAELVVLVAPLFTKSVRDLIEKTQRDVERRH